MRRSRVAQRPEVLEDVSVRQDPFYGRTATQSAVGTSSPLRSLRPCLGQGASQGKESVLADSGREGESRQGWVGEKSGLFEHPEPVLTSAPYERFQRHFVYKSIFRSC